ncbi:hypothetical protein QQF64_007056 [Cirrhinus molitorella]|uniref:Uncharacterized protein n=1 Tax=Cirrhinus molitorella TaxID=172907 RepID=A0ABR3MBX7_9TELE
MHYMWVKVDRAEYTAPICSDSRRSAVLFPRVRASSPNLEKSPGPAIHLAALRRLEAVTGDGKLHQCCSCGSGSAEVSHDGVKLILQEKEE